MELNSWFRTSARYLGVGVSNNLGPVDRSIVSLTSSFRGQVKPKYTDIFVLVSYHFLSFYFSNSLLLHVLCLTDNTFNITFY